MPKKKGRPPSGNIPAYLEKVLPKKETELHRQMRAYYLSLPKEKRTYAAVAQAFNVDRQTVERPAKAFKWDEDAAIRDASIQDPFYEEHQEIIEQQRLKFFQYLCTALEMEFKRLSFATQDSEIIEKIKAKDLEGATANWTMKEWTEFIKKLNIRASGYKEILYLLEGLQKVVFEWNPNLSHTQNKGNITIPGDNNQILIHYD